MTSIRVHPLTLAGYGLVDAPFERVVAGFSSLVVEERSAFRVLETTPSVGRAMGHLSRLTVPATRLVIVEHGRWTAVLTNDRTGSDFNDHDRLVSRALAVRTIRVVDSEARWWRRGSRRERLAYEARIFELRAPDGTSLRSIACADDGGRWVFETSGDPFPVEAGFGYDAPRKRDRFTRPMLHALIRSLGAEPLIDATLLAARRFALVEERIANREWRKRVEAATCSLEEADDPAFGYLQRGLGWVPYMQTHATSVIADLERSIEINPAYEPRVRAHLQQARRVANG